MPVSSPRPQVQISDEIKKKPPLAKTTANAVMTTMSNERMRLSFTYAIVGSLDGVNFTSDSTDFEIDRFFIPISGHDYLTAVEAYDPTLILPSGSPDKQFFAFILELRIPHFNKIMVYDPDINLALLFDPALGDPNDIQAVATPAVIAAIVIVVLVVVAAVSITAVKFVIWPRISRVPTPPADYLENATAEPPNQQQNQQQQRQAAGSKWRPVTADDTRLTNL